MAVTSTDVANQALALIGANQPPVTGVAPTFDNTTIGKALQSLYVPTVQTVARSFGWDFARKTVALVLTGNTAPAPWAFEFGYPINGVQVLQVMPPTPDPNDPLPLNWTEQNDIIGGNVVRVICANINPALVVYNNNPNESTWDSLFRQAVVELLARCLALAIGGKPDLAQSLLGSYADFAQLGMSRQD